MKIKRQIKMWLRLYVLILTLIFLLNWEFFKPWSPAFAQVFDVASTYQIQDPNLSNNDIVSNIPGKGLVRANIPYDNRIFGVYQQAPALVYRESTNSGRPVVRSGEVIVNVTDFNGEIKPGDFITSSPIPGYGMKATQSGYILGSAISQVTSTGTITFQGKAYQTGIVKVAIRMEYAEIDRPRSLIRFLDLLNSAIFQQVQDPERITNLLRYMIAGLIGMLSLLLGYFTFARSVTKGVEAIGRNPLASRSIQLSIILNLILTITTVTIGLILSVIILRL